MNQQQPNARCAHKIPMHCRGLFRRGEVTIFLEVNRQVSLMNWQISEYPISPTVTKLFDTEVGPLPLWHIHGGKTYRVKSGIFGQTANFGQQPCLFHISNTGIQINYLSNTLVKLLM